MKKKQWVFFAHQKCREHARPTDYSTAVRSDARLWVDRSQMYMHHASYLAHTLIVVASSSRIWVARDCSKPTSLSLRRLCS